MLRSGYKGKRRNGAALGASTNPGGEHCDARRISVGQSGKADLTLLLQGMEGMPETEELIGMFASAASDTAWMRSAELLRPLFGDLIASLLCRCSQIGNGVWLGLAILLLRQFTTWLEVNMERTISMAPTKMSNNTNQKLKENNTHSMSITDKPNIFNEFIFPPKDYKLRPVGNAAPTQAERIARARHDTCKHNVE